MLLRLTSRNKNKSSHSFIALILLSAGGFIVSLHLQLSQPDTRIEDLYKLTKFEHFLLTAPDFTSEPGGGAERPELVVAWAGPAPPGVVVGVVVGTGPPHVVTRLQHLRPGTRRHSRAAVSSSCPRSHTLRVIKLIPLLFVFPHLLPHCLSSSLAVQNFFKTFYSLVFCVYVLLQFSNSLLVQLGLSVSILFI